MKNYHTISIEQNFEELKSNPEGLSFAEAKARLEKNGKNVLAENKKKSPFVKFLSQFKEILIIVLLISAVISIVIGAIEHSVNEFVDAGIIIVIVFINAIIGFLQERKSERAMDALKNMTKPFCTVIRNKRIIKIKSEELVVGDVVILEAGDIVPADLRLFESNSLKIEESALTGESLPVEKDALSILKEDASLGDCINMAFMGSVVTYGRGKGVVVSVGMDTEMGKIASALSEIKPTTTPLTKRIKSTSIIITAIVLVVCLAVFIVEICTGGDIFSSFSMAIAIAVCAIPEGLPACNTVTMSMGVKRMSEQRAIVKTLPAVETLGSTEVICSDKTGTLTLNKMTVQKIFYLGDNCQKINQIQFDQISTGNAVDSIITLDKLEQIHSDILLQDKNLVELMRCMLLCNDTKVRIENDKLESIGDPTEIALVHYGYKFGYNKENLEGKFRRINEIPFDSERKLMSTINLVDDKNVVYTKGAVDNILSRCDRILDNGKIRKITLKDKDIILNSNAEFASAALRNLGFAFKIVEKITHPTSENTENGLCFLGIVGMIDPPRVEVKDAIKTCKQAGITTIMITGDHKDTAFAIAKELGICNSIDKVITGKELDDISDEKFIEVVKNYQVYARVNPQHKVRIVKALKANNKIVAMTGDGVNDAPSLKAADIGVGMGITGTDVTKEAADMILTDDNFATIVGAVKEGRRIYSTIIKILIFLLGTSIAELFFMSVVILFLPKLGNGEPWHFFTPALILWINFVSDTFVGLALGFEKAENNIMKRKPIKNSGNLFKGDVGFNIICSAIFVSVLTLTIYCICSYVLKLSASEVTTICFLYVSITELIHCYNTKSQVNSIFSSNPFDNKILNISFLGSLLLTVLIVLIPIPALQNAMGITVISWWQWLAIIGLSLLIIPYIEIIKFIIRKHQKRK